MSRSRNPLTGFAGFILLGTALESGDGGAFGDLEMCVAGEALDGAPFEGCGEIFIRGR